MQAREALALANQTRFAHSAVKLDLKEGRITLGQALVDERALRGRLRLVKLVEAMPYVGRQVAERALYEAELRGGMAVSELAPRQRARIVAAVPRVRSQIGGKRYADVRARREG